MAYDPEHKHFESPPDDAILWRYLDFTKLVSISAVFARSDKLGDPFEGSMPLPNVEKPDMTFVGGPSPVAKARSERPKKMLINCWHEGDYESAAMWRLYGSEHDGIAVRTTFGRLCTSMLFEERVFAGRVKYIDYATARIGEGNVYDPFVHKRRSFEHEHEVRVVHDIGIVTQDGKTFTDRTIPAVGRNLRVDLEVLVEAILVAPDAPDWFLELATSVCAKFALDARVIRSELSVDPVY